jgi:PepB aminopeptidase
MTQGVLIYLSEEAVSDSFDAGTKLSFNGGDIYIHIEGVAKDNLRDIQKAARKIEGLGVKQAKLSGALWCLDSQWAFAQGFSCIGKLEAVEFTGNGQTIKQLTDKLAVTAWSRELIHQPPADLYPETLAWQVIEFITAQAQDPDMVFAYTLKGEELLEHGWVGTYNVGKGSARAPVMMVLDYNPSKDSEVPVDYCLVGKGITFDSGGYSLKPSAGMFSMKADMGGAATVSGALALAIRHGLQKRVKLILCCAENMVSGHAYKLGDILTYKNGVSVEIANTDAEGRLVLADGLLAAQETQAKIIIDAATLTGAAVNALGGEYTALFSLDDQLCQRAQVAAADVGEPVWRLPLASWHKEKCPSAFADTANSRTAKGGGAGGASNAAGFLSRFAPEKGWLHLDLAADYNESATSLWPAGATGQGIASIAKILNSAD